MDYYKYTLQNARENFALDKTLMEKGENFFLYTTLQKSVLIGETLPMSSFNETNEGVILARYFAGAGPIFCDEGTIKVTFLLDKVTDVDDHEALCKEWIMKALNDLGIETTTEYKENDIYLNGKKICGIATKDMGDKFFLTFFLGLSIDFEMAARVMNLTKHTINLADRAIGINQVVETPISADQIFDSFKNNLNGLWGIELENPIDTSLPIPNFQKNIDIHNNEDWIKYGRTERPDFS